MIPKSIKEELRQFNLQLNRIKFPSTPDYARPDPKPYSDTSANGLRRTIIDFLTMRGHQAEPINNTPVRKDNRISYEDSVGFIRTIGTVEYRKSTMVSGTADVSATILKNGIGYSVKLEIKIGKDTWKPAQKKYAATIQNAGGIYQIVKTFDQFLLWYEEFMKS